jgi:hypothetical protein
MVGGVTDEEAPPQPQARPLRSRSSAGELIGGFLGGLDQLITGRPPAVPQIEEQYREPWASADGVTVDGLDEPIERAEPPDRSGARL